MTHVDAVDGMIDQLRRERTVDEPLHVTARRIFDQWGSDGRLDEATIMALVAVGGRSVLEEGGYPEEYPISDSLLRRILSGLTEVDRIADVGDLGTLAFLGFLAVAAESLMGSDRGRLS